MEMSHLTDQIAALEAELAALKATQKAEDDERARATAQRPVGIPLDWLPALFKVDGTFDTVAWYNPNYTISILQLAVKTATLAGPATAQGGKP